MAKHQKQKERLTGKQKKVLFWSCFAALSIAFLAVWLNVFLTSNAFDRQMEEMVLGEDYDREDVVITDKRIEDPAERQELHFVFLFVQPVDGNEEIAPFGSYIKQLRDKAAEQFVKPRVDNSVQNAASDKALGNVEIVGVVVRVEAHVWVFFCVFRKRN